MIPECKSRAAVALGTAYQYVTDKDAAWKDLIRLSGCLDSGLRWGATEALGVAFRYAPDKDAAWNELIRLTGDHDTGVQSRAAGALERRLDMFPIKMQPGITSSS